MATDRPVLNEALHHAVLICRGQTALARKIGAGVKQAHVWSWLYKTGVVPPQHLEAVEAATNGVVSMRELVRGKLHRDRAA